MTEDRKYPPFDFLIGRVTRNPVEEITKSGKELVKASVFRNYSYTKDDGTFVDVAAFGDRPKAALLNAKKGDRLAMEGSLKSREYNGKTYWDFVAMGIYRASDVEADDDL